MSTDTSLERPSSRYADHEMNHPLPNSQVISMKQTTEHPASINHDVEEDRPLSRYADELIEQLHSSNPANSKNFENGRPESRYCDLLLNFNLRNDVVCPEKIYCNTVPIDDLITERPRSCYVDFEMEKFALARERNMKETDDDVQSEYCFDYCSQREFLEKETERAAGIEELQRPISRYCDQSIEDLIDNLLLFPEKLMAVEFEESDFEKVSEYCFNMKEDRIQNYYSDPESECSLSEMLDFYEEHDDFYVETLERPESRYCDPSIEDPLPNFMLYFELLHSVNQDSCENDSVESFYVDPKMSEPLPNEIVCPWISV